MFPIVQIGPLAIQTPGLIMLASIWVGLTLAEKYALLHNTQPEEITNLSFTFLVAGIIGGRLGYAAVHLPSFIEDPISLFSINISLFDLWSGLAVGLIAGILYIQSKKLVPLDILDAIVPALSVIQIAIFLANLASGDGFGAPTELPWSINLWGTERHPTQIYGIIAGIGILWLLWPDKRMGKKRASGKTFLWFGALSAGARLFLEAFHGDSYILFGGLRAEQLAAWGVLAICLVGLRRISQVKNKIHE